MRTGVILLTSPNSEEADRIYANLKAKGILGLQCSQDDADDAPETITDFITDNRLEAVVVSNLTQAFPSDSFRHAIEETGLSRLAVSWVDIASLLGEEPSKGSADVADMTVLVNLARLQRADHLRNAVFRTLPRSSKISRRELLRSIPRVFRVESDIPIVLGDQCSGRSKTCDYCRRACPVNAVSDTGQTVAIDDRLCIECGACARDCPIGAIQCPSVSDVQMIAMLNTLSSEEFEPNKRALLLTCPIGFEKLLDEAGKRKRLGAGVVPVQIPCVASIGSAHYLWSACLRVTLVTVCPDISCKKAAAVFPLYRHVASSKNLLRTLAEDRAVMVHHLSLNASDSIVDSVSRAVTLTSPVDASARLSGVFRRDVMLDAVRKLRTSSSNGGIVLSEDSTLTLFDLKVDDARCTFCEFCHRDCPDRAIEFTKSEDSVSLMFDPALCEGCMICVRNCPEQAISLSRLRELSTILDRKKAVKARDENAKCENCGTTLGSKRSLTVLRKKLSEQGVADATLRTLSLCIRCKQETVIRPLGQHLPPKSEPRPKPSQT